MESRARRHARFPSGCNVSKSDRPRRWKFRIMPPGRAIVFHRSRHYINARIRCTKSSPNNRSSRVLRKFARVIAPPHKILASFSPRFLFLSFSGSACVPVHLHRLSRIGRRVCDRPRDFLRETRLRSENGEGRVPGCAPITLNYHRDNHHRHHRRNPRSAARISWPRSMPAPPLPSFFLSRSRARKYAKCRTERETRPER